MKILKVIKSRKNQKKKDSVNADEKLINEIRYVCRRLDSIYQRYEMLQDDNLIEASIYEIEALKSRYRYLLRLAKTRNISCDISSTVLYEKI